MKFYLCQTSAGPLYARTQADAKAIDASFELVEYDTDQASLVSRFNDLLKSAPEPVIVSTGFDPERITDLGREMDDEDGGYPEPPAKPRKGDKSAVESPDWQSAPPAGSCKRCVSMSAAARQIEGIMAATNIEHTLFTADAALLDRIQAGINDRRKEIS